MLKPNKLSDEVRAPSLLGQNQGRKRPSWRVAIPKKVLPYMNFEDKGELLSLGVMTGLHVL